MDIKTIELFERYNAGELSSDELIMFNSELDNNPEFLKQFKVFKAINKVLANKDLINTRRLLKEAQEENFGKRQTRKISLYRISSIAASLLVLISVGIYFWYSSNQNIQKEKIFSPFYTDIPVLQSDIDSTNTYITAINAYKSHDFKNAELLFSKLCESDTINSLYKFNLALVYLATEKYNDSEKLLIKLINEKNQLIEDNSQWFLGVIYYKTKDYDKAREVFKHLADNKKHFKSEDAKLALEIIEEEEGK